MQQFDLIIVGGGLAGASLAVALRNCRLQIALVESSVPKPAVGWDARVYAVSPTNVSFLEAVGVWRHLSVDRLSPIRAMQIAGDAGGQIDFSAYETGVSELGWIVESSLMACELWESVKRQSNLTLFSPAKPESIEFLGSTVHLSLNDGQVLAGKLLVGADGRDSWVRRCAGLDSVVTPYGQHGVVANFSTEKQHRGVAYQWFRDDGILAFLPLPGNKISIVWSTPDDHAEALCSLPAEAFALRVAEAGANVLGKLEQITPPAAFPLRLIRVPQTVARRLVLVGDAAHGIHPLSGHGINLGFQDVQCLVSLLEEAQPWRDIGELPFLLRYQRARREETYLMQTATDRLHRLFCQKQPVVRSMRNVGLNVANKLPLLKNLLVRYALGSF